jgi:hypothetical protein
MRARFYIVAVLTLAGLSCARNDHLSGSVDGSAPSARSVAIAGTSTRAGEVGSRADAGDGGRDASVGGAGPPSDPSAMSQMIDDGVGELSVITGEKTKVVEFVEHYLDSRSQPFPVPRKFLVERRQDLWLVSVINLSTIGGGAPSHGLTVHVAGSEKKFRIMHVVAW